MQRVKKSFSRDIKSWIIAGLPFGLYVIPKSNLLYGHSLCLFSNVFGVECWGCGITRAVVSAMYLDFDGAWGYNNFVFVIIPLILYLWVKSLITIFHSLSS